MRDQARDLASQPLHVRFDHLLKVMRSGRFLNMEGLNNEIPFYICPFAPRESSEMEKTVHNLISQLANAGIPVCNINLYDLSIALLKERDIWQRILDVEPTVSKEELLELLQGVLDPERHLVPAIEKKLANKRHKIIFLSGVGAVYPYIRSHNVLNNLQSTATHCPTVMFFPGTYTHSLETGASLDLFGLLHDDKYYRAFNIYRVHA